MPVRSALLFVVPLTVGLCSYSCSFDVISLRRSCCSVLHLARVLSCDDKKNLNELLYQAGMDPEQCQVEPLSGPGFCNALYKVQCRNDKMVGKLFSNLAKRRMPLQNRHCIDWMASKRGLGPKLFSSTDNGILMEWLEEKSLDETIVHGSVEWVERVAPRLAAFHYMIKTPNPPNVLWKSLDIMMNMMQDTSLVEGKVSQQRQSIEPLDLPTVLGHGDLKPSNIIGEKTPRFIDLEISGMHYRGYDLAKLFRTKHPTRLTKDNLKHFLDCYLRFCPVSLVESDKELDLLRLEAKIMEPLTWLEAAVFFSCAASMDPENQDKWNLLATDRLESYEMSASGLERCIDEYREKK